MKSPTRLADAGSPASDVLRKALRAARADLPGARRLKTIGAGLGALAGGLGAAPAAAAGGFATVAVKIGVAVTAILAATGAGVVASRELLHRQGARASSGTTANSAAGPAAAAAPVDASLTPRAQAPSPGGSTSSDRQMASASEGVIAAGDRRDRTAPSVAIAPAPTEVDLLRRAERALRTNPALALALANEDAARFPRGALTQEREVIAIEALLGLGRLVDARAEATRLFHDAPDTAHRARVEALLTAATDASIHNR